MSLLKLFKSTTFFVFMILLTASVHAQIRGNGNVVTRERDVPAFSGLAVEDGIDVMIKQGDQVALEIKADENLHEYIYSEVKDNILRIYTEKNIWNTKAMDAYVTVTDLKLLKVSGGGDVESLSTINAGELKIALSGGGDLEFDLVSEKTVCDVSGGGDVELSGEMGSLKTGLSGGGDLVLSAQAGNLIVNISGGGDADISGGENTDAVAVTISGGGDLDMKVNCNNMKIEISGGGDAFISAGSHVDKAQISITGGGDLELELSAENLKASVGSGGDAECSGSAVNVGFEVKGGGDLDASRLTAVNAMVTLSGGSDAQLNVTGELKVNVSGGGDVYVTGNPEITEANLSGGSKIHKR